MKNTLLDHIERAAAVNGSVTFVNQDEYDTTTWGVVNSEARVMAANLQAKGVKPGDHIALFGPTTRDIVTAIEATWSAGCVLVMLPLPMRMGSIEEFVEQTRNRIAAADIDWVIVDPQLAAFIEPIESDPPFFTYEELAAEGKTEADWVRPDISEDDTAILQFTSGSTSEPKGVVLPHGHICRNLDGAARSSQLDVDNDVLVTWLPLYHDMGLIGLLGLPMTTGTQVVLAAPQDFLSKPERWVKWMSDFKATATAGPNFAFTLLSRSMRRSKEDYDLSNLRVVMNGAEPIDPDSFRSFFEAGAKFGLKESASYACFGMAEVCIAGSFPRPDDGLLTDTIDADALEHDRLATPAEPGSKNAREFTILGRPVEGLEFRVVDTKTGEECEDRQVGELLISGTSLTPGYYKNPKATAEAIVDGWLRTGDLAYLLDGQLVICGRIKDLIIIGGRNIYPQDIEKVVGEVADVRTGNVVAFGEDGKNQKQHITVVAEHRGEDPETLRRQIAERVTDQIGVPAREIVLVGPGTIPKTSSGKLQRSATRQLHREGALEQA